MNVLDHLHPSNARFGNRHHQRFIFGVIDIFLFEGVNKAFEKDIIGRLNTVRYADLNIASEANCKRNVRLMFSKLVRISVEYF